MLKSIATFFVDVLLLYTAIGVLFAAAFSGKGITKVDSQALGTSLFFRLLVLPDTAAFWPWLMHRWLHATGEPPAERNPHRGSNLSAKRT